MLKLILVVTVAISVTSAQFDHNRRHYTTTQQPIDYNEDIYNRDFSINPNSNLHFSFQQLRKDQPPQIDERVENLHKYLYQRPSTTTPSPHLAIHRPRLEGSRDQWNVQPAAAPIQHAHLPDAPRLSEIDESAVISQVTGRNHHRNNHHHYNPVQHQTFVPQPTQPPAASHWSEVRYCFDIK